MSGMVGIEASLDLCISVGVQVAETRRKEFLDIREFKTNCSSSDSSDDERLDEGSGYVISRYRRSPKGLELVLVFGRI